MINFILLNNLPTLVEQLKKLPPNVRHLVQVYPNNKIRSIEQNDTSHCWYLQLSRDLPQDTALGWKCHCKLHYGVPLLRANDLEFKQFYDRSLKQLTYEQKLEAMRFVPVTSIMKTKVFNEYLELLQVEFRKQGVMLEFLNEPPHE